MKRICMITMFAIFLAACAPKKLYYINDLTPPQILCNPAIQIAIGIPPLHVPAGKRKTIQPNSQKFILAIPNCIDMSGRAGDLRRSMADMLYTTIFATHRFHLYDRQELNNLDPEWLKTSLKSSMIDQNQEGTKDSDASFKYLNQQKEKQDKMIRELNSKIDGLLLVYITSRVMNSLSPEVQNHDKVYDPSSDGGHFDVDYRIVSGKYKIVLFAGSHKVRYQNSTTHEVEYFREDMEAIANSILNKFPRPDGFQDPMVIAIDGERIVINSGTNKIRKLIPGLRGYVVHQEDSIYTERNVNGNQYEKIKAQHYSYLARFLITEVYEETSTGILLPYRELNDIQKRMKYTGWDVRVGDKVKIK